ncbi:hypothetical protein LCGC14_1652650 [marine sediment metagenome]|uniref:Uncharacterized protein n=1 Tax=marine sediment metagenome TaxID=412755 RepID=A0A0F9HWE4_9ZZZZ
MNKNRIEFLNNELNIDEKIEGIKNILNTCEQIFISMGPIMEKFLLMEEAKIYLKNGSIDKLIELFAIISEECKKLSIPLINFELLLNLKN